MPTGPSPDHVNDPRFEVILANALAKNGLDAYLGDRVRMLVTGKADPRAFQCCNSGCTPCVKDYLRAAETVLQSLDAPVRAAGKRRWYLLWLA